MEQPRVIDVRETALQAVQAVVHEDEGDPVERLSAASELRMAFDNLVTEFVIAARAGGATWSEIGTVLGVSTQAAHQRYRHVAAVTEPTT